MVEMLTDNMKVMY